MAIDPVAAMAIIKGEQIFKGDEDFFRAAVAPGEYEIDTTVRIRGTVKIGPDTERTVAASVPWQRLCAHLLSKLNGTTIEAVVREVVAANGKLDGAASEVDERAKAAIKAILGTAKQPVRGSVSVRCEVEELEN